MEKGRLIRGFSWLGVGLLALVTVVLAILCFAKAFSIEDAVAEEVVSKPTDWFVQKPHMAEYYFGDWRSDEQDGWVKKAEQDVIDGKADIGDTAIWGLSFGEVGVRMIPAKQGSNPLSCYPVEGARIEVIARDVKTSRGITPVMVLYTPPLPTRRTNVSRWAFHVQ